MLGLESGFVVLSFGGAVGGFSVGRFCFFVGGFLLLGCWGFLLSLLLPFFRSWGSRSARPWGWLTGVFLFSITLCFTVGHTGLCTFRV